MKNIIYTITFFSEWHCGSGLSSGSDMDELVIKDKDGFPYIPGKTLKGLLKNAAMDISDIQGNDSAKESFITGFFGFFDDKTDEDSSVHTQGKGYFTNAVINPSLKEKSINIKDFFYKAISSTTIDDEGIAKDNSLRRIETTIPCVLYASIYDVDEKYISDIKQCMKWIKRMGMNRNRGLGRCRFEILDQKEGK